MLSFHHGYNNNLKNSIEQNSSFRYLNLLVYTIRKDWKKYKYFYITSFTLIFHYQPHQNKTCSQNSLCSTNKVHTLQWSKVEAYFTLQRSRLVIHSVFFCRSNWLHRMQISFVRMNWQHHLDFVSVDFKL